MTGYELISNIVTAALWPVVVLVLGIMFRDTLKSLLERLKALEGLGAKLELSESIKQLDQAADSVQIESATRQAESPESVHPGAAKSFPREAPLAHLAQVAHLSPSAAILDAWREVEEALFSYWASARKHGLVENLKTTDVNEVRGALGSAGYLSDEQQALLKSLRVSRNQVAHSTEKPTEGQALAFVEAAGQAMRSFRRDAWSIEKGEF